MGCQSTVSLGSNLTFSICTHDADTGAVTDTSAPPTYRIYEDETATPILTGTMAVLDTANTTGFYTEQIACTTANTFEAGKSYTIYIEATVDGITGGIAYGVTVEGTSSIVSAIMDYLVAGTYSVQEVLRIMAATTSGKPTGVGTHTVTFRDLDDSKDVVVCTLDDAGNVLTLTLDSSA